MLRLVVPIISPAHAERFLGSCHPWVRAHLTVVDNTVENLGVARAWNLGRAQTIDAGDEYLVICSEALTFGDPGGYDLVEELLLPPHYEPVVGTRFGWKLIAIHRRTLEVVGEFDEAFHPAYFEDVDYARRMLLAGFLRYFEPAFYPALVPHANPRLGEAPHLVVPVDATAELDAHTLRLGLARVDWTAIHAHYVDRWGGSPGWELYDTPGGT